MTEKIIWKLSLQIDGEAKRAAIQVIPINIYKKKKIT